MTAGRPRKADPGTLYTFAHQFYWDFKRVDQGSSRRWFDKKEHERLKRELAKVHVELSEEQRASVERGVQEESRIGRLKETEKEDRRRAVEDDLLRVTREWMLDLAADEATKLLKIPGEPDVVDELLRVETPEQIQRICEDAFVRVPREVEPGVIRELRLPNWPIPVGSVLPLYLSQYASEFIAAKNDPRFPQSTHRPTSRLKQLWFLSRALAGALFGVATRTAINLVGSKRPEQVFEESRAAKPFRKRAKLGGRPAKKAGEKRGPT